MRTILTCSISLLSSCRIPSKSSRASVFPYNASGLVFHHWVQDWNNMRPAFPKHFYWQFHYHLTAHLLKLHLHGLNSKNRWMNNIFSVLDLETPNDWNTSILPSSAMFRTWKNWLFFLPGTQRENVKLGIKIVTCLTSAGCTIGMINLLILLI